MIKAENVFDDINIGGENPAEFCYFKYIFY